MKKLILTTVLFLSVLTLSAKNTMITTNACIDEQKNLCSLTQGTVTLIIDGHNMTLINGSGNEIESLKYFKVKKDKKNGVLYYYYKKDSETRVLIVDKNKFSLLGCTYFFKK